jgi:DNA-binding response OmpR family regulator
MAKILVIDDDQDAIKLVVNALSRLYDVETCLSGRDALHKLRFSKYDLIVLDLMLRDSTGTEVCSELRSRNDLTPVLMLTSVNSERQTELNLDAGADDYLTKPFTAPVLQARIRAILRRSGQYTRSNQLVSDDLILDTKTRKVFKSGSEIHIMPREFALLEFFMRHPNEVFSVPALMERVWQSDSEAMLDTVRAHIKTLRKKVDSPDRASKITNVRGLGYRFEERQSSAGSADDSDDIAESQSADA